MSSTTAVLSEPRSAPHEVADRLRRGYERQDPVGMSELYADDASWELHVGDAHVLLRGRHRIAQRYADDLHLPADVRRWDVRVAPWGAVVEAEAEQGEGRDRVRYRWVHLLTVEQGRIVQDAVYCTGAVPVPGPG